MQSPKSNLRLVLHGSIAAFGVYFCMYAFRKPFTVASFEGMTVFTVDYKIAVIIAQIFGYMMSKFIGIKVVSEMRRSRRAFFLIALVFSSEVALALFALTPSPYNVVFMFFNGLPLGMIWGIVFSYLEGRRFTEVLGVALCSSFIVSSGIVKSVGLWTINTLGVSEFWMPATTGALFALPLVFFTWLIEKLPGQTEEDIRLRTERRPMNSEERVHLVKGFFLPLSLLVVFYIFLTVFRDFRDNFARELWDSIGYAGDASVYTTSELIISIVVLAIMGCLYFFKENFKCLVYYHLLLVAGLAVVGLSTALFESGTIGPFAWMTASGFGLYLCYVPMNAVFFDRFIAAFSLSGNAGFLIYIADSFGYLGSVLILLYKNFGAAELSWLEFFTKGTYAMTFAGIAMVIASLLLQRAKYRREYLNPSRAAA